MPALESIKKLSEKATGWARPKKAQLPNLLRKRKPNLFRFKDDGIIPNHPTFPLIIYRGAVSFPEDLDPAAVFEDVFQKNGWGDAWRNGIYDYVHYHSKIHEVLGIARGSSRVQFGGKRGRKVKLKAGDVAILPAGTGHQCLSASNDFLVIGAYPSSGKYDECTTAEDHERAVKTIPRVARPRKDPLYGEKGPVVSEWRRKAHSGDIRKRRD
jgi:uncharacterized protein YjlB